MGRAPTHTIPREEGPKERSNEVHLVVEIRDSRSVVPL